MTLVWSPGYAPVDEYYDNVSLLLYGNGTNGSTTITDSSPTPKTVTAVGNAQISTAQSKFGGASIAFDGAGDRLTLAAASDWNFSGGPHTFECWFYLNTLPGLGNNLRLAMAGPNNVTSSFVFAIISNIGAISAGVPFVGKNGLTHSSLIAINTWYHYACVLNNTSSAIYLNGVGTFGTIDMPTVSTANTLFVGFDVVGTVNFNLNGYIDDLRITKGVARDVSTVPTASFPDLSPTGRLEL